MINLLQKLKKESPSFPRAQRRMLEYILNNGDESVFLNIRELAQKAGVSKATVVRLAKTLGFAGFPDMQKELRQQFRNKLTTTFRLQKTIQKIGSHEDIAAKVLQRDIQNISETLEELSLGEFKKFMAHISAAKRVFIVGLRSAHSLAIFLGVALQFLRKEVWVIRPEIGDMWDRLLGLRKGDVVIGISFPRYTRETIEVLKFARGKGVKTLAITDTLISPLAHCADHVLTARYQTDSFIESFTAPLSLINALVTALGVNKKRYTFKYLKESEVIWEEQQIYYKA